MVRVGVGGWKEGGRQKCPVFPPVPQAPSFHTILMKPLESREEGPKEAFTLPPTPQGSLHTPPTPQAFEKADGSQTSATVGGGLRGGGPGTVMLQSRKQKQKLFFPEGETLFQKRGRGERIPGGWDGLKWACIR